MSQYSRRSVVSWAFYDWANSAFATTVIAGFFPLFLKSYWAADVPATQSTWYLGNTVAAASLMVMLLAPVLGAIADRSGGRKRYLASFMSIGVMATAALYFIPQGGWVWALAAYFLGVLGFFGGNVFYDSLILDVAPAAESDRVSALGYGLGYLGGGLLFAINVAMSLKPEWFGLVDQAQAVRVAFLSVSLWWLVFSMPLLFGVHEQKAVAHIPFSQAVSQGFRQLVDTFAEVRQYRQVFVFLLAYWLYIDGVDTIIHMAVDYGAALGFRAESLITALLLTQFIGFPSAIAFGYIGQRWGTLRGIFLALFIYMGVTCWGYWLQTEWQFYVMAGVIGLVQGGVQSLSRAYYARIIPQDKAAEFFGFYNMMGKFAAIIGPLLVAWTAGLTGNSRLAILSILVLFVAGTLVLASVARADRARSAVRGESR